MALDTTLDDLHTEIHTRLGKTTRFYTYQDFLKILESYNYPELCVKGNKTGKAALRKCEQQLQKYQIDQDFLGKTGYAKAVSFDQFTTSLSKVPFGYRLIPLKLLQLILELEETEYVDKAVDVAKLPGWLVCLGIQSNIANNVVEMCKMLTPDEGYGGVTIHQVWQIVGLPLLLQHGMSNGESTSNVDEICEKYESLATKTKAVEIVNTALEATANSPRGGTLYTWPGSDYANAIQSAAKLYNFTLKTEDITPGVTPAGFPEWAHGPLLLTETNQKLTQVDAIFMHIAGENPTLEALEWVSMATSVLHPAAQMWAFPTLGVMPNNKAEVGKGKGILLSALSDLNKALMKSSFLGGDSPSVADCAVIGALQVAFKQVLTIDFARKNLVCTVEWVEACASRGIGNTVMCEKEAAFDGKLFGQINKKFKK